jgi:hypothetical protein
MLQSPPPGISCWVGAIHSSRPVLELRVVSGCGWLVSLWKISQWPMLNLKLLVLLKPQCFRPFLPTPPCFCRHVGHWRLRGHTRCPDRRGTGDSVRGRCLQAQDYCTSTFFRFLRVTLDLLQSKGHLFWTLSDMLPWSHHRPNPLSPLSCCWCLHCKPVDAVRAELLCFIMRSRKLNPCYNAIRHRRVVLRLTLWQ